VVLDAAGAAGAVPVELGAEAPAEADAVGVGLALDVALDVVGAAATGAARLNVVCAGAPPSATAVTV